MQNIDYRFSYKIFPEHIKNSMMGTMMERIKVEERDGVLILTLHNPEKRNAIDEKMIDEIKKVLSKERENENLKVMLIQGEGKIFCSGGDLKWMERKGKSNYEENLKDALELAEMYKMIWDFPTPVVVKVQGGAYGGGMGFIAVSDISVAEKNSKFRTPEIKVGLIPAVISVFLIRKIGLSHTKFLALTAREITAEEAKNMGLINIITEEDELDSKTWEIIEEIKSSAPKNTRKTKELINLICQTENLNISLRLAGEFISQARASSEGIEGIMSFLEKRKPNW
ncbi:1,4-dihydroxy-2-naphthoyl-CoA synthase [bacterium HR19]|nr:1,4-dihydroxy-2-naphthoyl-CoA synthase [bacterium HR19]